jgi:hypothetical protein
MATWHVTVDSSVHSASKYTLVLAALLLKRVRAQFESMGFTVCPLPEGCVGLSVSHSSASAISVYLLRYDSDGLIIVSVV